MLNMVKKMVILALEPFPEKKKCSPILEEFSVNAFLGKWPIFLQKYIYTTFITGKVMGYKDRGL